MDIDNNHFAQNSILTLCSCMSIEKSPTRFILIIMTFIKRYFHDTNFASFRNYRSVAYMTIFLPFAVVTTSSSTSVMQNSALCVCVCACVHGCVSIPKRHDHTTNYTSLFLFRWPGRSWIDNPLVGQWIGMNGNPGNFGRFQWRCLFASGLCPFPPDRQPFPLVQRVPSIQDLPKDRVHVVQMGLLFVQNEKLGLKTTTTTTRTKQNKECGDVVCLFVLRKRRIPSVFVWPGITFQMIVRERAKSKV